MNVNIISEFRDVRVTVMGLGRYPQGSGMGAAKWLLRHGARVTITDLNSEEELRAQVETLRSYSQRVHDPIFVLGEHREQDFTDADLIVMNPGVPRESRFLAIAHEHGIQIESDVSLFFHFCPFPIIAVTGTRGKSTTTALIGEMLKCLHPKAVVAGNIQHSPLEDLDWLLNESSPVPVVLELSSWLVETLEHVQTPAHIAVMTNLYEDHLNRYANFEAYCLAKEGLFLKQAEGDVAILNKVQQRVRAISDRTKARVLFYDDVILPLPISEIALQGAHNVENVKAAIAAAREAGVSDAHIAEALHTFTGLPSRQQIIRVRHGVTFVNDTTATSPDGTIVALDRFQDIPLRGGQGPTKQSSQNHIILISGGASKDTSFAAMGKRITETCKHVVLFEGTATEAIVSAIGENVPTTRADSMQQAVDEAVRVATPGDIVLLSPGAASFGLFKNEFDRGDQFVHSVMGLTEKEICD